MGQLSGGEKAQLTYTILCSAIAYQSGITREGRNSKSLRFIAVDESFSNQDEEKATYRIELCKQLHLQLLVVTPSEKSRLSRALSPTSTWFSGALITGVQGPRQARVRTCVC